MAAEPLAPAAQRVQDLLVANGSACRVRMMTTTARSAAEAAAAIGCTVGQIAKSLVFKAKSGRAVLVVASGVNRVDEAKLTAALGEPIGKADADFVRERTGYAIGGVAPVGHGPGVRVFLDRDLADFSEIWAAAGHPHAVFPLDFAELQRLTRGEVIAVK